MRPQKRPNLPGVDRQPDEFPATSSLQHRDATNSVVAGTVIAPPGLPLKVIPGAAVVITPAIEKDPPCSVGIATESTGGKWWRVLAKRPAVEEFAEDRLLVVPRYNGVEPLAVLFQALTTQAFADAGRALVKLTRGVFGGRDSFANDLRAAARALEPFIGKQQSDEVVEYALQRYATACSSLQPNIARARAKPPRCSRSCSCSSRSSRRCPSSRRCSRCRTTCARSRRRAATSAARRRRRATFCRASMQRRRWRAGSSAWAARRR